MSNRTNKMLSFHFPSTMGGISQGGNDPAAEFFEGVESIAVVRESLQNIIDAKDPKEKVAKASFQLLQIKPQDMPGITELTQKYEQCVNTTPDRKIKKRFENAKRLIANNKEIPVLKISDHGTVGLTGGDNDYSGNYHNFMKAVGATNKSGSGNGGSFGIGKAAYLAASTMKIKFVSSIYLNNSQKEYVFQGKASLISHEEDGDEKQGTGFLGVLTKNRPYPIRTKEEIPDMFVRETDSLGTDIYIVGYEEDTDWEKTIAMSVLAHFWMAIDKCDIEVVVGKYTINKDTLEKMLHDTYYDDMATKENPLPYYLAYKKGKMYEKKSEVLGNMRLYALKSDYPCGVAYFRTTGMRIEIKHKNDTDGIAYVFVCNDKKGNALLRDMEPPSHDRWVASKAEDEGGKMRPEAQKAIHDIKNFVRDIVDKENGQEQKDFETIPDLDKFFTRPPKDLLGDDSKLPKSEGEQTDTGNSRSFEKHRKVKGDASSSTPKPHKALNKPGEPVDGTGGGVGDSNNGNGGNNDGSGGDESSDSGKLYPLGITTIRAFAKKIREKQDIQHAIIVHTKPNTNIVLKVFVIAEDGPFSEIGICNAHTEPKNSEELQITEKNTIKGLRTSADGVLKVLVSFDDKVVRHTIQVNAYENR